MITYGSTKYGTMAVDWEERFNPWRMREERVKKAKRALADSDVDALFVFKYEDVRYLTGHRTHMGPTFFFGLASAVLAEGEDPVCYTMDMDHSLARETWLREDQVRLAPALGDVGGIKKWAEDAKELLAPNVSKIGVDIWTPDLLKVLPEVFPNVEFVDGNKVLANAKIIKTEDELHCLRQAYSITAAGFQAALDFLKPGVRECEVLAVAWAEFTAKGSEWTQCSNIICSGPYTAPYRRFTSDRIIQEGDLVIIDIGACYNGYWGDFTRTYICGDIEATEEQKEVHQDAYDAIWSAAEVCKPGNTNLDIVRAVPERNNLGGVLGHGSGVNPWEEPGINSAYEEEIVLKPGMQFNIEPYAGNPEIGYGVRLENNFIITEDGCELYSTLPFDKRLLNNINPLDPTTGRK